MRNSAVCLLGGCLVFFGCSDNNDPVSPQGGNQSNGNPPPSTPNPNGWLVPVEEVFDGGTGKDGIPALLDPEMVETGSPGSAYLAPQDLVLGLKQGNEVRAYPHKILDWHEIINDQIGDRSVAITYCPLTGTGIGWDRMINGEVTTFGVSGLLYQTNLMPYDRLTESTWSQMRLECVNGELIGTQAKTYQVFETEWETWVKMFPNTLVVSENTGFSRSYGIFSYGDYRTNHNNILFPFAPVDDRLPVKERVLGILIKPQAKVFPIRDFGARITVINDSFSQVKLVIAGSSTMNFAVAYESALSDGTELTFEPVENGGSAILKDNEGTEWDVFGEAVSGPRQGDSLVATQSLIGYWFTFGSFYPHAVIHNR